MQPSFEHPQAFGLRKSQLWRLFSSIFIESKYWVSHDLKRASKSYHTFDQNYLFFRLQLLQKFHTHFSTIDLATSLSTISPRRDSIEKFFKQRIKTLVIDKTRKQTFLSNSHDVVGASKISRELRCFSKIFFTLLTTMELYDRICMVEIYTIHLHLVISQNDSNQEICSRQFTPSYFMKTLRIWP